MFIVEKSPKSVAAEAYRSLKTNIQYSSFDKEYKTIVILVLIQEKVNLLLQEI